MPAVFLPENRYDFSEYMPEVAVPTLVHALAGEGHERTRRMVARSLGALGPDAGPAGASALARAVTFDPSTGVRVQAARSLGELGAAAGEEGLVALTLAMGSSEELPLRQQAAEALRALEDAAGESGLNCLARALGNDPDARLRARVAQLLGEFASMTLAREGQVRALRKALHEDPDMHVRIKAAWALGQCRCNAHESGETIEALVNAQCSDCHSSVRKQATESLREFPPAQIAPPLTAILEHGASSKDRLQAAQAMGALAPLVGPMGFNAVRSTLRMDESDEVRRAAVSALLCFRGWEEASIVETLHSCVTEDEDPTVRQRAVVALGELGQWGVATGGGDDSAARREALGIAALSEVLGADPCGSVRAKAAESLGVFAHAAGPSASQCTNPLQKAVHSDRDTHVRVSAVRSLISHGAGVLPESFEPPLPIKAEQQTVQLPPAMPVSYVTQATKALGPLSRPANLSPRIFTPKDSGSMGRMASPAWRNDGHPQRSYLAITGAIVCERLQ